MQVTVSATVTFDIGNEPKGPHGKAILEQALIDRISGKIVDPSKPIEIVSDLGPHEVTLVEIFVPGPLKINYRQEPIPKAVGKAY